MIYVLDTNILLAISQGKRAYFEKIFDFASPTNDLVISAVTIGEMRSLAGLRKWGSVKLNDMEDLFKEFIIVDINNDPLLNAYAEIDVYSLSHHPTKSLKTTARKMGKNDLWIAATTSVLKATLITTDKDFEHLDNVFLTLICIEPNLIV